MLNQYQIESHAIETIQNYLLPYNFIEGNQFSFIKRNVTTFQTDFVVLQTNSSSLLSLLHQFSIVKSIYSNAKYTLPFSSTITNTTPNSRKLLLQKEITEQMQAQEIWSRGFFGEDIKVAVLDTGLRENHNAFENVEERVNFTSEESVDDLLGHGTFVAGVIASKGKECKGFAPKVSLHIYKVFTGEQVSYTSWFIDAFNYAIQNKIHIINLSIGGPDTQDQPFIDKVHEAVANNIIVVSAIGNDGPLYGTLNNPADLSAVIGVGGIDDDDQIASFSSRGATTWELNHGGYGRMKPDFVTYGNKVKGTARYGGCNVLSGTSVAAPVITGCIALLASTLPEEKRWKFLNPASVKQLLQRSAEVLPHTNIFEQGMGKVNLLKAFELLQNEEYLQNPKTTFFPPNLDLTSCPYMWPFCTQHIYHTAMPLVVNVTILNPLSLTGRIVAKPTWTPTSNGKLISVSFSFPDELWPFSGYLAIHIVATEWSRFTEGVVEGNVVLPFESINGEKIVTEITLPLRLKVIKTPARMKRLLWDQYHNIQYPPKYVPRDNLNNNDDVLDWNGDHPHTNFKDMFNHLRNEGYFLEVLNGDLTTFDASNYAALLLVDTEDEFTVQEREKLKKDVEVRGLSLVVIAEWYNVEVMKKAQFYDENTKKLWVPITGGANVPALNGLLEPYGITLGAAIYNGELLIDTRQDQETRTYVAAYYSGTSIIRFPEGGMLAQFSLEDQTKKILYSQYLKKNSVPVIGFYQHFKGKIVVFGDSSCMDAVQRSSPFCAWMVDLLLDYAIKGTYPHILHPNLITLKQEYISENAEFPLRNAQSELPEVTKVPAGQVIASAALHPLLNSTNYEHARMIEEIIRIRRVKLFIPILLMFAVVTLVIILSIKRRRRIVYRALLRSDRRSFSQDFDQSDDI